jgi:DNA-nicking Smr family endonuclease
MQGVRRLRPHPPRPAPLLLPSQADSALPPIPSLPAGPPLRQPGPVDRATLERLDRGRVQIDARIDLHGLTQAEAFAVLIGFVESSARGGRRAILVITGKGGIGEGGGVLRRNVPGWLLASPVARRILTIVPAHRRHGGDGALYVLLRRIRR